MGWMLNDALRPIYPLESAGTHCTGGWRGPRTGPDGYNNNNNNNNNNNTLLQLGCHPVAVVILHVNKT